MNDLLLLKMEVVGDDPVSDCVFFKHVPVRKCLFCHTSMSRTAVVGGNYRGDVWHLSKCRRAVLVDYLIPPT